MARRASNSGVAVVLALIWALIVLLSIPAEAQTLSGPDVAQREASRRAFLRTLVATDQCMGGAILAALRNQITDRQDLTTFAVSMCGLQLFAFLKQGGGFTDAEIGKIINNMAAKKVADINN